MRGEATFFPGELPLAAADFAAVFAAALLAAFFRAAVARLAGDFEGDFPFAAGFRGAAASAASLSLLSVAPASGCALPGPLAADLRGRLAMMAALISAFRSAMLSVVAEGRSRSSP